MKKPRKRVNIVTLKMIRESSVLYEPRVIKSPLDAVNLLKKFLLDLDKEEMVVLTLDTKNQPTNINICSIGSLDSSIVHPREVFKIAVLANAASILIAHNHPSSGNPEPSKEDITVTKRIKKAGEIMGIELLDHIIIGDKDRYISLKEKGLM